MAEKGKNGHSVTEVVEKAVLHHGTKREELIPILSDINRILGYLPAEALKEVSSKLKVSQSQVLSVASFYNMLNTKPVGRHIIRFCESAPCHVAGGLQVWRALQEALNIKSGETSQDSKWTLFTTSCLGVCGVGPVFIVDDDIYGNARPEQVAEILGRYE